MCGAAQNMTWLIVCRAVQGIGGGGIIQLVQITISDIVSLQEWVCATRAASIINLLYYPAEANMEDLLARLGA